jgi:2-methylcitrate dehydratase PrpD
MSGPTGTNSTLLASYISDARNRDYPPEVVDAARMCLTDWLAVAVAARNDTAAIAVHRVADKWCSRGRSMLLRGGYAAAPVAALVNGTLAHILDFDDTHVASTTHFSGPLWAAILALGAECETNEDRMLKAFITGFEVGARIGRNMGPVLSAVGWHSTGMAGRLGAAAACSTLLDLTAEQSVYALGIAATQVSGLTASFGTMAKPFHVGKAAMDGLMSAQLAAESFTAATDLLEWNGPLSSTLVQDQSASIGLIDFNDGFEILNNTFKFHAACLLAHPSIEAARSIAPRVNVNTVVSCRVKANPLAAQLAGLNNPKTPTEGKFSIPFCVALGLSGHSVGPLDFSESTLRDPAIQQLASTVEIDADDSIASTATTLHVHLNDGQIIMKSLSVHRNTMPTWTDIEHKFLETSQPALSSADADALFFALRNFGSGHALPTIKATVNKPSFGF